MPTKRRRRPVIEEVVETAPHKKVVQISTEPETESSHVPEPVSEAKSNPEQDTTFTQTVKQVASYDEPPTESNAKVLIEDIGVSTKPQKKTNMKLILVITVLTALIVGFISGGVYVYVSGVSDKGVATQVQPTLTPSPVPTITPSPKPVVKLDTLKVNVLNGSGIIGAAGKVKDALESAGFTVNGTGNAQNYSFKSTVIQVKESTEKEVLEIVKNALSNYTVEVGDPLPSSSKYDIVVTAGKN